MWRVLNTGISSAEENMRIDKELLEAAAFERDPLLHLYDWRGDCATYGYLVDPFTLLSQEGVEKRALSLARRSTGGGVIFHLWDLAFSVVIPSVCELYSENTLQNYALINKAVLSASEEFVKNTGSMAMTVDDFNPLDSSCKRFCMAQPTKYDVIMSGKKVAGAAQRKTKGGFLHQGTISLMLPSRLYLQDVLLPNTSVLEAMFANTYPLMGPDAKASDLPSCRADLQGLLVKYITNEG